MSCRDPDGVRTAVVAIESEGWQLVGDVTIPAGARASRPAPAVLLLNGAGRDRSAYAGLSARLAALGIGSLRVDLRGMGESTNLGRFVPFDTTGRNDAIGLDRTWRDVQAALDHLLLLEWVDSTRVGAVAASYSGEALAQAIRARRIPRAIAALSPGSFSDASFEDVAGDGRRWLFVYSARETIVRRGRMDERTHRSSGRARVVVVEDSAHASDLLSASPMLEARLAEWFTRALGLEPGDARWRVAADGVAALLRDGWDDTLRPGEATASAGEGVAGRLLFLVARHEAVGDAESRQAVVRAADQLVALLTDDAVQDASLYRGDAGAAVALLEAGRALGEPRYEASAIGRLNRLRARQSGGSWSASNDVLFGDAGTIAALHHAGRLLGDTTLRALSFTGAHTLLARARPEPGGLNWRWRESAPLVLPNFSHGAAGIGTVLALLGRDSAAPPELLEGARGAARYVESLAVSDERGFRVPYGWPVPDGGWGRPFDASWAHGQAGTARLFWALWEVTRDTAHLATVRAAVLGLDSANVTDTPAPGYGTDAFPANYRFGLAGIADLHADLYDETGDRRQLERAVELAEEILRRSETIDGALGWTAPRPAFLPHPGDTARFTGYLHGAAGPGLLFLKLDALLHGRRPPDPLPDSPFGR